MVTRRNKRTLLWILILVGTIFFFGLLSLHRLLDPEVYRPLLQERLSEMIGKEVFVGKATVSFWPVVGIAFDDVRVKDRSHAFDLFRSRQVVLRVKILPLLWGDIRWHSIHVDEPLLHIHRQKSGEINLFGAPLEQEGRLVSSKIIQGLRVLFGEWVIFKGGKVFFVDEKVREGPLITTVSDLDGSIENRSSCGSFHFRIEGTVDQGKRPGHFTVKGVLESLPKDMDVPKGVIEADVEMEQVDTSHFWPYLRGWLPMKRIASVLDLRAHYRGDLSGVFTARAKMRFENVLFDYPKVFPTLLTSPWVEIGTELEFNRREIRISQLSVALPELWIKARGRIYDIGLPSAGMEAEAQTGAFDLKDAKRFIPYGIISPKVSQALLRAEGKGGIQFLSVRLAGTMTEIYHCDELPNAHVLSVELEMGGNYLQLPWNIPPLENLRGLLAFKDGHLGFKGVQGEMFRSTLVKGEGFLYRLLHEPRLQIELQGHLAMEDIQQAHRQGFLPSLPKGLSDLLSSLHTLSGHVRYELSLEGEIEAPSRLLYQGTCSFSRVRYTDRRLPFPIFIEEGMLKLSNDLFQWVKAKVEFGNCFLLTSGSWRGSTWGGPVRMEARGEIDLSNTVRLFKSPLFPETFRRKMQGLEGLSGRGEIIFQGHTPRDRSTFHYEGRLIPKGASYHPEGLPSPFSFHEGTITFSDEGVVFSRWRCGSKVSSFTLDGWVRSGDVNLSSTGSVDLKELSRLLRTRLAPDLVRSQVGAIQEADGEAEFRLTWSGREGDGINLLKEGEVRFKKVFLRHATVPFSISQLSGFLLVTRDQFRLLGFDGKFGSSLLQGSAEVSRPPPKASPVAVKRRLALRVMSPDLSLDLLLPRREEGRLWSFERVGEMLRHWDISAKIEAERGAWKGHPFQGLKVEANTEKDGLNIRPLYFKAHGGDLWAEGWLEPREQGVRLEGTFSLAHMDAAELIRTCFAKEGEERVLLSGRVRVPKMELRGEGKTLQGIKESLQGSLKVELENGVIERGHILAKIFSLLNVSTLFQGRLPDLKTRGLPYHRIGANIKIERGIAMTEDLLVDSDAMRITAIGKVDLSKNLIDAKIGIHPLVTLDTILSHVPIAGYILTGKDKAFISYLYEVKGPLNDPMIEAVPVKAFGEGVFGIIKRLLETPLRPFQ